MSQTDVPLYDPNMLRPIDFSALAGPGDDGHAPRILLLYGSLRPQSYSRAVAEEGARILRALGCETKFFGPHRRRGGPPRLRQRVPRPLGVRPFPPQGYARGRPSWGG